jgi:hypothetical protein
MPKSESCFSVRIADEGEGQDGRMQHDACRSFTKCYMTHMWYVCQGIVERLSPLWLPPNLLRTQSTSGPGCHACSNHYYCWNLCGAQKPPHTLSGKGTELRSLSYVKRSPSV